MRKITFLILIQLLLIQFGELYAQQIDWGILNKSKTKYYYPQILSEDGEFIYTYHIYAEDLYLESFTYDDKKLVFSEQIDLGKINRERPILEKVSYSDGKFLVFTSHFDRKAQTTELYAQFVFVKDRKKGELKKVYQFNEGVKKRAGKFNIYTSPDESKFMVNFYTKQTTFNRFIDNYRLFDKELNLLARRDDSFEASEIPTTTDYKLSNDGSLYFLRQVSENEKYIVSFDAAKELEKWEERMDVSKLSLKPGSVIHSFTFNINKKGELVVSGFYSEDEKSLDGYFYLTIDPTTKEVNKTKLSHMPELSLDDVDDRTEARMEGNLFKDIYKYVRILNKEDGGIVLIGEQFVYDQPFRTSLNIFYFGNIIVFNISPDGELIWVNHIPKSQLFTINTEVLSFSDKQTLEYFSYVTMLDDAKVAILFNDSRSNASRDINDYKVSRLSKLKNSQIVQYTLDLSSGEKSKKVLADQRNAEVYLKPTTSYQKSQNSSMVLFGANKNDFKFGTFKF